MASVSGLAVSKVVLRAIAIAAAILWLVYWILVPIPKGSDWLQKINLAVTSQFLGTKGSLYLLQVMPIVAITFAGLFGQLIAETLQKRSRGRTVSSSVAKPRLSLWTLPAFVRSPMGMLTFGELVIIIILLSTVAWYFGKSCHDLFYEIDHEPRKPHSPARWVAKLREAGVYLGLSAQIPLALLWIPVSRGSPILRVIGVSFERAVKYHIWLGQFCIMLLVGHGVTLVVAYYYRHEISSVIEWQTSGVALLPGIVALAAGIIMFITALSYMRRNHFDVFITIHHLYLVFFIFFVFHAVKHAFFVVIPALLFFVDRFTRFVQSRKTVDLLSVKVLSSSALELRFKKPPGLNCNPLAFVYLQVPSVSRMQWHPFSLTSSPLGNPDEITICIKPVGWFTRELHKEVSNRLRNSDVVIATEQSHHKHVVSMPQTSGKSTGTCPFSLKVGVEGPYGDSSNFYLQYRSLILVAGGIGITPFISLLRDILHRYKIQQKGLPSSIHLIVSVRDASELCILNALDPSFILSDLIDSLSIQVHAYITSDRSAQDSQAAASYADFCAAFVNAAIVESPIHGGDSLQEMSPVVGSGNTLWVAATVLSSLVGFTIAWGFFNLSVLGPNSPNYKTALILLASMAVGVIAFGGSALLLWSKLSGMKLPANEISAHSKKTASCCKDDIERALPSFVLPPLQGTVTVGCRPNWRDKMAELEKQMGGQNVGVLVSGPPGMQEDVARECQYQAIRYLQRKSDVVFHFHSVSFEL